MFIEPLGFPGGSDSKESACNAGDLSSVPGERNGYPLQYSCLKNSMEKGSWQATSPWDHKELNTSQFDSTGESES